MERHLARMFQTVNETMIMELMLTYVPITMFLCTGVIFFSIRCDIAVKDILRKAPSLMVFVSLVLRGIDTSFCVFLICSIFQI